MAARPGEHGSASGPAAPGARYAVRIAVGGDVRFLAHMDLVRALVRALIRARLTVRYSRGFNPHPRVSMPMPRNVGVESSDDLAVVELAEDVEPGELCTRLSATLPDGCRVLGAARLAAGVTPRPFAAEYRIEVDDEAAASARVAELLSAERLEIERPGGPGRPSRRIDVRAFIGEMCVRGGVLRARVNVNQDGAMRPSELLGLLGLSAEEHLHRTRRAGVEWNMDPRPAPSRARAGGPERTDCVTEEERERSSEEGRTEA